MWLPDFLIWRRCCWPSFVRNCEWNAASAEVVWRMWRCSWPTGRWTMPAPPRPAWNTTHRDPLKRLHGAQRGDLPPAHCGPDWGRQRAGFEIGSPVTRTMVATPPAKFPPLPRLLRPSPVKRAPSASTARSHFKPFNSFRLFCSWFQHGLHFEHRLFHRLPFPSDSIYLHSFRVVNSLARLLPFIHYFSFGLCCYFTNSFFDTFHRFRSIDSMHSINVITRLIIINSLIFAGMYRFGFIDSMTPTRYIRLILCSSWFQFHLGDFIASIR